MVTIQTVVDDLQTSFPTTGKALAKLATLNIVREVTGKQRGRIYVYSDYLALLSRGTEPLPN